MKITLGWIALISVIMISVFPAAAQSESGQASEHQTGKGHHDQVDQRGDQEMGFSHVRTAHHFRLKTDGGIIEVSTKSADDTSSRNQIRRHLNHIVQKFAAGDFSAPMLIHGQTPPGVETMQRLKAEIVYRYQETERGARVRIASGNADAVKAIHEFLQFQIQDHRTGDTVEIERGRVGEKLR